MPLARQVEAIEWLVFAAVMAADDGTPDDLVVTVQARELVASREPDVDLVGRMTAKATERARATGTSRTLTVLASRTP